MITQEDNQKQTISFDFREKLLMLRAQIPTWEDIKSNELIQSRAKKFGLLLIVLATFYFGLNRFLGPQWPESNYSDFYRDEFVAFNQEDWKQIDGEWIVVDGQLIQNNFLSPDPAIMLSLKANPEDTVNFSASIEIGDGGDGGGIRFNVWSPDQIARSHQVSLVRQRGEVFLIGGYYGNSTQLISQFKLPVSTIPQENIAGQISVTANEKFYDVYLNGQPMIMGVPAVYPPGWHGLAAIGNAVAFNDMEILVTEGVSDDRELLGLFTAEEEPTEVIEEVQTFVEGDLIASNGDTLANNGWTVIGGDWIERNGKLLQTNGDAFDARLTFGVPYESFQLEMDIWHPQTAGGGGIIFGLESPEVFANAYLMRFAEDGSGIFIGQYDEDSQFVGLEFQPLDSIGNSVQTIGLTHDGTVFQPSLNGEPIFDKFPRNKAESYIGLVSNQSELVVDRIFVEPFGVSPEFVTPQEQPASEGSAEVAQSAESESAVEPVSATASESNEQPTIPLSPELANITGESFFQSTFLGTLGETNWVPFRGEWSIENGSLIQSDRDGFDFAIGYDEPYENFVLRTTFTHLEGQGAGVLFAMTRPDSRNLSHVVRYDSGQSALLFGFFDENGQFAAQGGEAVSLPGTDSHQFDIVKTETTYDIYVDGLKVVGDVPLQTNGNYIGLTSSTSVVRFDSVELFPLNPSGESDTGSEAEAVEGVEEVAAEAEADGAGDENPAEETEAVEPAAEEDAPAEAVAESPEEAEAASEDSASDETAATEDAPSEDASESEVAETEADPASEEATESIEETSWLALATPLAGEWTESEDGIVQSNTDLVDQVLALNQLGTIYTLEVDITMTDDPDIPNIGSGMVFNAPAADSENDGQIVRFLNGGNEVIWGYYDENGRFNGQGGTTVGATTDARNILAVQVRETEFDIIVNGEIIAVDLPLRTQGGGYAHLITFRGPVTFNDVRLTEQGGE